jgi:hypothetical protein
MIFLQNKEVFKSFKKEQNFQNFLFSSLFQFECL